jgi:hypothetical protein
MAERDLAEDLAEARALYVKLAARIAPSQQTGVGRRTPPASRPPLNVDMVSAMAELETFMRWWNATAAELLGDRYRRNGQGEPPP